MLCISAKEELTSKMNFTHSSRNSWALIRRLGAAQQPPKSTHPSVSANAVAAHLIQVAKAPHDKKFERQVCMQGRTLLQQMSDKSLPHTFTEEEISAALQKTKPATAPGYDNIHVEFLKNLGPTAHTWLSKFFSRIMATHSVMYNMLSSLAACGRLGSIGAAGVFVWQAASGTRQ